jgi:hypothetical protein
VAVASQAITNERRRKGRGGRKPHAHSQMARRKGDTCIQQSRLSLYSLSPARSRLFHHLSAGTYSSHLFVAKQHTYNLVEHTGTPHFPSHKPASLSQHRPSPQLTLLRPAEAATQMTFGLPSLDPRRYCKCTAPILPSKRGVTLASGSRKALESGQQVRDLNHE